MSIDKTPNKNPTPTHLNTSSIESQISLRVEKMNKLKELGFDPFPVDSSRDFTVGFVKFWFDFVHKFDITKLQTDESNYLLEHYLAQALFPQSLLETMEEKIQIRHTARQMGIDPDEREDFDESKIDETLVNEIRELFPELLKKSKEDKEKLLAEYLFDTNDESVENITDNLEIQLTPNQKITLAGRIKDKRGSGKIAFGVLEDESCPEGFQLVFKKDLLDDHFAQFTNAFSPDKIKDKLGLE